MTHTDDIDRQWMLNAACRGWDPEIFFPDPHDNHARAVAEEVCIDCPVVEMCREYARATGSHHGVWGGRQLNEKSYRSASLAHRRQKVR